MPLRKSQMQVFSTIPIERENQQNKSRSVVIFWYSLSLAFAITYIVIGMQQGFSSKYVVSDDAREYLPWVYRYFNKDLFPNDLIADYFQSVTPIGYSLIYKITTFLGIDPILFSKILPIVLGIITTSYCFAVCMQILAVPMAGFMASLLLNQSLGLHDDLFSATPRDFIYPVFLAFIYYLLRNSWVGTLSAIALQALIYPLIAFVDLLILFLRLFSFQNRRISFAQNRKDFRLFATAMIICGAIILAYAIQASQFGPTITAAVARTMPDYWPGGRVSYFTHNTISFWLDGRDSGCLALIAPLQLLIGFLLPIILYFPSRFPLVKQVKDNIKILPQVVIACLTMFFTAHAVAFKLHWPSRYTHHTFKMVLALASAIALTVIIDAVLQWSKANKRQFVTFGFAGIIGVVLIFYPSTLKSFPKTPYVTGTVPVLYEFLLQQPQDIVIASTSEEADNIPIFANRSVLVGKEFALPFHTKYYAQLKQRMLDIINTQYSQNIDQVKDFIQKHRITYWLLERSAFTSEYIVNNNWLQQYQPAAQQAINKLQNPPILSTLMDSCAVIKTDNLVLLLAECITATKT